MNSYAWPPGLATQYAQEHGITEPPGGLQIPTGIAIPVDHPDRGRRSS